MKAIIAWSILLFCLQSLASVPSGPHISINGEAQLEVKPDIVVLHLSVKSQKLTSLEAKQDVDLRVNNFLASLEDFGLSEDDISASSISVSPEYQYVRDRGQEIIGYFASRELKVTIEKIDSLNDVMDFALSVEINQINNIEFKSSKKDAFQKQVLMMAVENAKTQVKSLAEAFDANLGKVYSISSFAANRRDRFGANRAYETIQVTGSRAQAQEQGRYLQENIVFSASVNAIFNLTYED